MPIHALVERGGGLHHLCIRCESVDAEVVRLQGLGLRVLAPQQPEEAFEDEMIAFLYAGDGVSIAGDGVSIELIDTEQRAGRLPGGSIA